MKGLTLQQFNEKIHPYGFEAEAKNNGYQYLIRCRGFNVSYYPTTDRWVDGNNKTGKGLNSFVRYLRGISPSSLTIKMPKREFICKRVFMASFVDPRKLISLYGFYSFEKWYDYAMASKTGAWMTAMDGTRLVLLPEWGDAQAKEVMRQMYFDIEDIVRAIRSENVEI